MNKAQVSEKVITFIKENYKNENVDEETALDECGVDEDGDMFSFTFALAEHFDVAGWVDGGELEENMCVWHAIDFIWDIL